MRYVLENIEAGNVPAEIQRRGIPAKQLVRVTLETLENDLSLSKLAEEGHAFDFLADEPDLYSDADIRHP